MSTHNLCFDQKFEKNQIFFLSENFPFLVVKLIYIIYINILIYINCLNRCVFVMKRKSKETMAENTQATDDRKTQQPALSSPTR